MAGNLGEALSEATSSGQVSEVTRLLGISKELLNYRGVHGSTALHVAARLENIELLNIMLGLSAKENVDQQDDFGRSALHYACARGLTQSVAALLQAGASLDMATAIFWTPLHFAVLCKHLPVVEQLLAANADVSATDNLGWSPLHIASREGLDEVAERLVQYGADVNAAEKRGWTALHIAVQSNRASVVRLLIQSGANVNCQEETGWAPLHIAAQYGFDQVARLLLSADARIDLQSRKGRTALLYATQNNRTQTVSLLLEAGADVFLQTPSGINPLVCACSLGYRDITLQLIRHLCYRGRNLEAALPRSCASFGALDWAYKVDTVGVNCSTTASELHTALANAGFTAERSATLIAAANVMQSIMRRIAESNLLHIVGSYSDGLGSSLVCFDGRIDSDSDIDVTTLHSGSGLHLKGGRCRCCDAKLEFIVEYENGHVKKKGFPASPSRAFNGSNLKPAMDNVTALPLCAYPYIDVLENPDRLTATQLAPSVLDSLLQELRTPNCHVVEAAPPGKDGQYLRVSTTFFERILIRSLSNVQGHVFIILKYIVKSVISKKVQGLKAYHAKTLIFHLLDEIPPESWKPQELFALVRRALETLIGYIGSCGPDECMKHFFMADAILYLKKAHSSKELIMKTITATISRLEFELAQFLGQLQRPQNFERLYFQPFLMIPHSVVSQKTSELGKLNYTEIYNVVKDCLVKLSQHDQCASEELYAEIHRIPDSALTTRESLRILTWLKFKKPAESLPVIKSSTEIPRPIDLPTSATDTEAVWHHLHNTHSTWKFCFHFDPVPRLNFLPEYLRDVFPCQTRNYHDYRYVNFDALYVCLCLELQLLTPDDAAVWFEEVVADRYADVQQLYVTLHYCQDIDLLVRLIQAHSQSVSIYPVTCDKLDELLFENSSLELVERGCMKTLQLLANELSPPC